jgi:hypothetical protein
VYAGRALASSTGDDAIGMRSRALGDRRDLFGEAVGLTPVATIADRRRRRRARVKK